jgi:hypothetical protein
MAFTVDIKGLSEAVSRFEAAPELMRTAAVKISQEVGRMAQLEAREAIKPYVSGTPTGRLAASIHTATVTESVEAARVVVGTALIYSRVQEEGAVIRAKTPNGLRFQAPRNSGIWYRKSQVTIPGKHYMAKGAAVATEAATAIAEAVLEEVFA